MFQNFKVITLSGAARGGQVGACAPGRRPWKYINTLDSDILKTSFSAEI